MQLRYRYRLDPTPGQRQMLARTFGCARVVYNDALAERKRAHLAGEKLSDTEVQRRVVTLAKRTPQRAWLAEVASVALVQAIDPLQRHRHPRPRRPFLRLVRGPAQPDTAAARCAQRGDRPRPDRAGGGRGQ